MPIGYDYRCNDCDHEWLLFSTRYAIGPTQWGAIAYTCFSCQTFLRIAKSVDKNSWRHWLSGNVSYISSNPTLESLADQISIRLNAVAGLAPVEIAFDSIECPTCESSTLSTIPFGQHNMRCSKCREYTGEFIGDNGITIYGPTESDAENA